MPAIFKDFFCFTAVVVLEILEYYDNNGDNFKAGMNTIVLRTSANFFIQTTFIRLNCFEVLDGCFSGNLIFHFGPKIL